MTPVEIERLLDEIVTLPSLPQNVDALTRLVNDPDASLGELAKAIAVDPAFTLKTLRLVNSAYYGVRQEVTSIELAVTLLGTKVIRNLVLTAVVCETLRGADMLLRHSVACGLAMRALAERSGPGVPVEPDEAFTYGLLHDIGKVVFECFLPEEGGTAAELSRSRQIPLHEAEKEVLGLNHAELGALLANRWKLPQLLADSIAGHHRVTACAQPGVRRMAGILAVANAICTCCGLPAGPQSAVELGEADWSASRLSNRDILPALDRFFASLPMLDELTGLGT